MSKDYYVILTGSKNNAGDFLIKYRAKQLFSQLRPDREIIDFDGWVPFDQSKLEIVNNAKALVLTGGPALQKKMRPRVYGLTSNLSDINTPLATMGIGWYSPHGKWHNTHRYALNSDSKALLARIAEDGLISSVRDYHTLNVLNSMGFTNYLMTGCPALYSKEHMNLPLQLSPKPKKIGFSLGVAFQGSRRMLKQMQDTILMTRELFPDSTLQIVFHHGISDEYLKTDGMAKSLFKAQTSFLAWLAKQNISHIDISGSAEKLVEYYSNCDFHIGYRLHAHIFMSSISKPSVLLNEDGRGIGIYKVLGGINLDAYSRVTKNKLVSALHKFGIPFDHMKPANNLLQDYKNTMAYEMKSGVRLYQPRENISLHYRVMKAFLRGLP